MITREELYELVWKTPMLQVAKEFNVSSSYMARVCTALEVPRPPPGYWARKEAGQSPSIPSLPPQIPGGPQIWTRPSENTPSPLKRFYNCRSQFLPGGSQVLLDDAKRHLENATVCEVTGYLRPRKRQLIDITTSPAAMPSAMELLGRLFKMLETRGHRIAISLPHQGHVRARIALLETKEEPRAVATLWRPSSPTVVYVNGAAVGLALIEIPEQREMRHIGYGKFVTTAEYQKDRSRYVHVDEYCATVKRIIPSGRLKVIAYSTNPTRPRYREFSANSPTAFKRELTHILAYVEEASAYENSNPT